MFTYICLGTNDLGRAIRFYDPTLAALGLRRCIPDDVAPGDSGAQNLGTNDPGTSELAGDWNAAGWGTYENGGAKEIALWLCKPFDKRAATPGNGTMVAFSAKSWHEVDGFHAAAVASGGSSEGLPGLRPQYNPDFYAAYVRDPDGNKLAAVCRGFTNPPRWTGTTI
jgi:catechol 2,3-dioxygenase-like lactoylglutathione lyase family enzyme